MIFLSLIQEYETKASSIQARTFFLFQEMVEQETFSVIQEAPGKLFLSELFDGWIPKE